MENYHRKLFIQDIMDRWEIRLFSLSYGPQYLYVAFFLSLVDCRWSVALGGKNRTTGSQKT